MELEWRVMRLKNSFGPNFTVNALETHHRNVLLSGRSCFSVAFNVSSNG